MVPLLNLFLLIYNSMLAWLSKMNKMKNTWHSSKKIVPKIIHTSPPVAVTQRTATEKLFNYFCKSTWLLFDCWNCFIMFFFLSEPLFSAISLNARSALGTVIKAEESAYMLSTARTEIISLLMFTLLTIDKTGSRPRAWRLVTTANRVAADVSWGLIAYIKLNHRIS